MADLCCFKVTSQNKTSKNNSYVIEKNVFVTALKQLAVVQQLRCFEKQTELRTQKISRLTSAIRHPALH
jgi:hypothetical protein